MTPQNFTRLQALVSSAPSAPAAFAVGEALRALIVARHAGSPVEDLAAYSITITDPVGAAACRLACLSLAARYLMATPSVVEGAIEWTQHIASSETARRELRDLHGLALVLSGALGDQASPLVIGPSALDGANRDGSDRDIASVIAPLVTRAQAFAERDADLDSIAALFPIGICNSADLLAHVAAVQALEASISEWETFAGLLPA